MSQAVLSSNLKCYFINLIKIIMIQMLKQILYLSLLVYSIKGQSTLARVNCINYAEHTYSYLENNAVGLSMDLLEVIPEVNNQLFQQYLINSQAYGSWSANFGLILHNINGCKYNCTLVEEVANHTVNCTFDMDNQTFLQELGYFSYNTSNYYSMIVGWDNQGANYVDQNYMENSLIQFAFALRETANQPFQMQMVDKGDTWDSSGFMPGFTFSQPSQDCANMNKHLYIYYNSPGITQAANSSWFNQINNIQKQCGQFTLRGVVFQNASLLTISNLLSQNYTTQYLKRRFYVDGRDYISELSSRTISFNDIRLVQNNQGVDQLTNSFAAAIWAVQIIFQWAIIKGYRMHFFSPIGQASFQSPLGMAPSFNPSTLYYGLLFAVTANTQNPYIIRPTVSSGLSSSIKSYYLDYGSYFGVVILNKDQSASASGVVAVEMKDLSGLHCMYLSADNLSSTTATFGNYSFISGNALPQGTFYSTKIQPDPVTQTYQVPLNYSQIVFCKTIPQNSNYLSFPRDRSTSWQISLFFIFSSILIFFAS